MRLTGCGVSTKRSAGKVATARPSGNGTGKTALVRAINPHTAAAGRSIFDSAMLLLTEGHHPPRGMVRGVVGQRNRRCSRATCSQCPSTTSWSASFNMVLLLVPTSVWVCCTAPRQRPYAKDTLRSRSVSTQTGRSTLAHGRLSLQWTTRSAGFGVPESDDDRCGLGGGCNYARGCWGAPGLIFIRYFLGQRRHEDITNSNTVGRAWVETV